jgi:sarcosine oxidase
VEWYCRGLRLFLCTLATLRELLDQAEAGSPTRAQTQSSAKINWEPTLLEQCGRFRDTTNKKMTLGNSKKHYDVAVVGAGVFGAWTAYQLQRSGGQVALIDAHGPGNSRSSSGDESRIVRMGYGADEVYTRSAVRSLARWQDLFAASGENLFFQTGVLWLAHDGDPYPLQTIETLERVGVRHEKLSIVDLTKRYPQFELERISWALLEPDSGVIVARRAVQAVAREAVRSGVDYLQDAVVIPNEPQALNQLATVGGVKVSARTFVFACGPWLPKLFPRLLADRIRPTRQEVFYFGAPSGDPQHHYSVMPAWVDFRDEVYGLPDIEGRGIKIAIDRHGPPFDPDNSDRMATLEGLSEVRDRLRHRLPALKNAPLLESRVCQYENTSNGDFLIDRHPDFENVWLVGGGSGHGFKHGPAVAEYVAARIQGAETVVEPRFSLQSKKETRERAVY